MPTYQQVISADLSKLTDAAKKWDEMAGKFDTMATTYKNKVQSIGVDGSWSGLSQQASVPMSIKTLADINAGKKEATAVASLLRQAESKLSELQGSVKKVVSDAEHAGMKVDDNGIASFDYSKVPAHEQNSIAHDPDLHDVEGQWTRRVADAVQAVNDADYGIKLALWDASNYQPLNLNGAVFNANADSDLERDEAHQAAQLALRLDSDGKLSSDDMQDFQKLMRANSHDTDFSQNLLSTLGAEKTLLLSNRLNDLAYGDHTDANDKKGFFNTGSRHFAGLSHPGSEQQVLQGLSSAVAALRNEAGRRPQQGKHPRVPVAGVLDGGRPGVPPAVPHRSR
ncbi:hypothetical protein [Streptantibioticus ferralitis]|uniref:Uncharacterized protein n=1 Tax=Streptantibioticus ferralitis TaxID=236510 RepID=A0ABT5ZA94_9ACTN|nr:hypothetical protein [Streptantibioticus ferralitis]MDF2260755.1 hypothetical protein [Streptantibioticus ferralitis]